MLKFFKRLFGLDEASPKKKKRAAAVGTAALVGVFGLTITATHVERPAVLNPYPGTTTIAFPECPATTVTKTGSQTTQIKQNASAETWDLTSAVWDNNVPDPIGYPIVSDSFTQGCILGGTVNGNTPTTGTCKTRDGWYNGLNGCPRLSSELWRITMSDTPNNWVLLRDAYAANDEDGFDPNHVRDDSSMYLDHVRVEDGRDDCIENEGAGAPEQPGNLYINNSFFNDCFNFLAERPPGAATASNGTGNYEVKIENSLVRITPQPLGSNYCDSTKVSQGRCLVDGSTWLGNYGIWKWSTAAAGTVTVRDTIFRVDLASYSTCQGQVWPDGTYENVTLVWGGTGAYETAGSCTNTLPAGVTLTTDTSVWDDAVNNWNSQ